MGTVAVDRKNNLFINFSHGLHDYVSHFKIFKSHIHQKQCDSLIAVFALMFGVVSTLAEI